jgi:hypothetical protein
MFLAISVASDYFAKTCRRSLLLRYQNFSRRFSLRFSYAAFRFISRTSTESGAELYSLWGCYNYTRPARCEVAAIILDQRAVRLLQLYSTSALWGCCNYTRPARCEVATIIFDQRAVRLLQLYSTSALWGCYNYTRPARCEVAPKGWGWKFLFTYELCNNCHCALCGDQASHLQWPLRTSASSSLVL